MFTAPKQSEDYDLNLYIRYYVKKRSQTDRIYCMSKNLSPYLMYCIDTNRGRVECRFQKKKLGILWFRNGITYKVFKL